MDDWRLKYVIRVRDLRAKLAFGESVKRRQAQARADATVEAAHRRRTEHEKQAARGGAWELAAFRAEDAHHVLTCVAAARLQVKEDIASIRRAELSREHARETADEARAEYRQAALRHETLRFRWHRGQQVLRRKQVEREDESSAEEKIHRWKAGA